MSGSSVQQLSRDDSAPWRQVIDTRLEVVCGQFRAHSPFLGDAMATAVLAPGKRFRGTVLLLAGEASGGAEPALVDAACALELVHSASLILDDLPCMDDATMRRGRPCTHVSYGESRAILAGVALITEALGVLAAAEGAGGAVRAQLVATLARALGPAGLCAGQDMDLHAPKSAAGIACEQDLKTGALFAAGFEMLGVVKALAPAQTAALVRLGLLLGRVFQSYDDLLDVLASREALGKDTNRDQSAGGIARGLLAVRTLEDAIRQYDNLRARLDAALADCPFEAAPLAAYTASVLPSAAPWPA